ncbi:hypothetical protein ACRRTK_019245 [Alexandromys fortis]
MNGVRNEEEPEGHQRYSVPGRLLGLSMELRVTMKRASPSTPRTTQQNNKPNASRLTKAALLSFCLFSGIGRVLTVQPVFRKILCLGVRSIRRQGLCPLINMPAYGGELGWGSLAAINGYKPASAKEDAQQSKTQHRMGEDTSGIHGSDLLAWDAEKGRLQQLSERMENAEEGWSLTPMTGCV